MEEINYKKIVAEKAVNEYIHSNMTIGLGSGSTAIWAVRAIASKYHAGELQNICCVTTGPGTQLEALAQNLPVYDLNHPKVLTLDVAIDGADEYDAHGYLLKGGGGCLLQEKIVGYSAQRFVVIVQDSKFESSLGTKFPLPIEVIPSALTRVQAKLKDEYDIASMNIRMDAKNIGPWITEEGNYLLDVVLSKSYNPKELELALVTMVGIVEVGIFSQNPPTILVVSEDGTISTIEPNIS